MFEHETVLKMESIEGLNIKPDGVYVDCTLGGAGHSEEIAKRLTTGQLYAFDQDDVALAHAKERLAPYEGRVTFIKSNFVHLKEELAQRGVTKVDGVL
ncbi:MAG: 16S rRNA (cytosine(1402)-N(4))-methyltransferase, partial [Exiguobacterium sp.]|nr:16S rRNA (cytosine(1402)-N(4))-methyltransferase [Exiguobacterium sp.]